VYEQHVDRLYRYALHCCGDPDLAEDIVAETFRRALEHWPGFEWRGVPVAAWLYRIASNLLAAHYRRVPALPFDPAGQALIAEGAAGPEQTVLRAERRREVRAAVAALPLCQRRAILLRYGEGLPLKEIALALGRSEGATKQCLHRALAALHRIVA
jgi:RNA polymerase sigma-70 factor (ECF subfamily)